MPDKLQKQNADALKIRDLICDLTATLNLPVRYAPEDFKINLEYVEPVENCPEPKIEVDYFTIAPSIEKRKSLTGEIDVPAWTVEALVHDSGSREEPPSTDSVLIKKVTSVWDAASTVLLAEVAHIIDGYLTSRAEAEIFEAEKDCAEEILW